MKYIVLGLSTLLFIGCSKVFGPTIQNGYSEPIVVKITYSDRSVKEIGFLDRCIHIGRGEKKNDIKKLEVYVKNKMMYKLNEQELNILINEEKKHKYKLMVWNIGQKGIEIRERNRIN